jgi:hypothetical protein
MGRLIESLQKVPENIPSDVRIMKYNETREECKVRPDIFQECSRQSAIQ